MISIKTNEAPILDLPEFSVDKQLHKKLNEYDITHLMNKSNFTLFLGKAGSGKSSLLISFLKTKKLFKKVFHQIFLFCPTNSRKSIKNDFWSELPDEQIFDEVSLENLQVAYDKARENAKEGYKTLFILDDVQKYLKGENEKLLLHIINNRRHALTSVWMCCQNYFQIPKQVRQALTDMFVFKINKTEAENLFAEQFEQHKDKFIEILTICFKNNHDFMYLNTNSQRIFSNFNELIIPE